MARLRTFFSRLDHGGIRVFANAYSPYIITAFQVYIDNQLLVNDTSATTYIYYTFAEPAGQHYVVVKAWDANGQVFSQSATVTVH